MRVVAGLGLTILFGCGGEPFSAALLDPRPDAESNADVAADALAQGGDAEVSDSGLDAPVSHPEAGSDADQIVSWVVRYQTTATNYGTIFALDASAPLGTFSGMCNSAVQTATVVQLGTGNYAVTPMAGCFETTGDPCILCNGVGQCPSGTTVPLLQADAGLWQGTCGLYTVTLHGQ